MSRQSSPLMPARQKQIWWSSWGHSHSRNLSLSRDLLEWERPLLLSKWQKWPDANWLESTSVSRQTWWTCLVLSIPRVQAKQSTPKLIYRKTKTKMRSISDGVMAFSSLRLRRDTGFWSMRWILLSKVSSKASMQFWTTDAQSTSLSSIKNSSVIQTSLSLLARTLVSRQAQHLDVRHCQKVSWIALPRSTWTSLQSKTTKSLWRVWRVNTSLKASKLIGCSHWPKRLKIYTAVLWLSQMAV